MLNQSHPLYKLADKIDWAKFDTAFSPLYCQNNGRPAKPIRLMCGLLILKNLRNLSDESVVEQWSENAYYQYFCGMQEFIPNAPCASSELVHFRNRIGVYGVTNYLELPNNPMINLRHFSCDRLQKNLGFPALRIYLYYI